jgi:hypothetical protein
MAIETGQASHNLKSGRQWYAYSGVIQGGPALPAFVTLISILSTGLKDSFIKIMPFYGVPIATTAGHALGIKILIDNIEVYESQPWSDYRHTRPEPEIELFIPRSSKLEIQSINTANNSLQDRGVTMLGWYL